MRPSLVACFTLENPVPLHASHFRSNGGCSISAVSAISGSTGGAALTSDPRQVTSWGQQRSTKRNQAMIRPHARTRQASIISYDVSNYFEPRRAGSADGGETSHPRTTIPGPDVDIRAVRRFCRIALVYLAAPVGVVQQRIGLAVPRDRATNWPSCLVLTKRADRAAGQEVDHRRNVEPARGC